MKHKTWFKTYQDRLLSDPAYLKLSPAARGIFVDLRCFAARTADHGKTGQTEDSMVLWYGRNKLAVHSAIKMLSKCHLIERGSTTGMISIPRWDENQETPGAARMRALRERLAKRHSDATVTATVTGETEAEADTPNPLPEIPQEIEQLAFRIFGHVPSANLSEWIALHGVEKVRAGLLETEKNGARSAAYTAKVLQSWARNGRSRGNGGNGHGSPEKVKLYDPEKSIAE